MSEKIIIPVLDFPGSDFISDEEEMIDYLVNYILRNPKESTEFDPDLQANLGELYVKHCNSPNVFKTEVEELIDTLIRQELGLDGYTTAVTVTTDSDDKTGITVAITNASGNYLTFKKWFKSNTEE